MLRTYTCIVCPNGCELSLQAEGNAVVRVTGGQCLRGEAYARQEWTAPQRTLATSVAVEGGELPLASVRLTKPIPKENIFQAMAAIRGLRLSAPVPAGRVLIRNLLGTGSDVITTRAVPAKKP